MGLASKLAIIVYLNLDRWNIPNWLHQSIVVELKYPLQGSQFHRLFGFPRGKTVNQFGFVQPINRFSQEHYHSDCPLMALCQPGRDVLCVQNGQVLRAPVRM